MLAELAAANAAFSVIKQCVSNGKEIADAASSIGKFVGAKEDLQKKVNKKGGGSDLEEFLALEKIREQEEQLKQIMIYTGRPGLWNDWVRFQAKARVARREAEQLAIEKRKEFIENTIIGIAILAFLGIVASVFLLIANHRGLL